MSKKAKVFTRLVSLQTPVVIHHSERESMTERESERKRERKEVVKKNETKIKEDSQR